MVLVAGEYRRRGLATALLRQAMDELATARLLPALDATPEGRAVYRRLGFEDSWGFHRLIRRERQHSSCSCRTHIRARKRRNKQGGEAGSGVRNGIGSGIRIYGERPRSVGGQ